MAFKDQIASFISTTVIPKLRLVWRQVHGYQVITVGCLIAFILGYLGTWAPPGSFILLCCVICFITVTQHAEYKKNVVIRSRQLIAENEMMEIERRLKELPSWVQFPEEEKAEWLNAMLNKFWPFVERYVQDFIRTQVEPQVKESLPGMFSLKFGAISLGTHAPRVSSIKTFAMDRENVGREIIADLDWMYPGDCNIQIVINKVPTAGIQNLNISGKLRAKLSPILTKPPFAGAVTFYFTEPPALDFNLTNAANLLDLPGFNEAIRGMIRDQIDSRVSLPNRMVIPLCQDPAIDLVELRFPMPEGIMRIAMVEAKDLEPLDVNGKSDPYAVIQVGAKKFRTRTIHNSLNPVWNEIVEAPVFVAEDQRVKFNLFDSDTGRADEDLGNASVGIKQFTTAPNGFLEKWSDLSDTSTGKFHMMASWLIFSDDPNDMRRALQSQKLFPTENNTLSVAYVKVAVLSATNLPRNRESKNLDKKDDRPSPLVRLKLVGQTAHEKDEEFKTQTVFNTCDPEWLTAFNLFSANPNVDQVVFEVRELNFSYRKFDFSKFSQAI